MRLPQPDLVMRANTPDCKVSSNASIPGQLTGEPSNGAAHSLSLERVPRTNLAAYLKAVIQSFSIPCIRYTRTQRKGFSWKRSARDIGTAIPPNFRQKNFKFNMLYSCYQGLSYPQRITEQVNGFNLRLCMSGQNHCPNGRPDCEFDDKHELALVAELMRAIALYNKKQDIDPCPLCLRNTMLTVAALLHIDAAQIESSSMGRAKGVGKRIRDAFAKTARDRLEAVIKAQAARSTQSKH